jgi:hypothetical protein
LTKVSLIFHLDDKDLMTQELWAKVLSSEESLHHNGKSC